MGGVRDGTTFLTGRGLARLVGIENRHVRTIRQDWTEDPPKPGISAIKSILEKREISAPEDHIETSNGKSMPFQTQFVQRCWNTTLF